jgi:hypothetical protein
MDAEDQDLLAWDVPYGECFGCDDYAAVNDDGLCRKCSQKLERDLIRQREWDYSVSAYGLTAGGREELRNRVIAQYGKRLELIAEKPSGKSGHRRKKRKKRRNRARG